jgi:hypothetical protein
MEFYPTILANNEKEFRWNGKMFRIPGLFTAEHIFKFAESKKEGNVGGTTFLQAEEFWGGSVFMIRKGAVCMLRRRKDSKGSIEI